MLLTGISKTRFCPISLFENSYHSSKVNVKEVKKTINAIAIRIPPSYIETHFLQCLEKLNEKTATL